MRLLARCPTNSAVNSLSSKAVTRTVTPGCCLSCTKMVREVTSPSCPQSSLAKRSKSCFLLRCKCIFGNARSGTRTHSYESPRTMVIQQQKPDRSQFHYHFPQPFIYTAWHSVSTNSTIRGKTVLLCSFLGFSSLLCGSLAAFSHDRLLHTEHWR